MAGEATIGALRVILGLDSAQFEDSLKSAQNSLGEFGKQMAAFAGGITLANLVDKAFSAIVESINGAIEAADKLQKASQKFGIPVESLNALSNAAALSDVSLESLGTALSKVSKNMIAAQNSTSDQAAAFKALGISVKDANGNFKSQDEIVNAVADSFASFRDGATKTALAVAIFGKAGADLVPVLNQGSHGIKEINDEMGPFANALALAAGQSEKFKDTMQLLAQTQQGVIVSILSESGLLRAMTDLAQTMLETTKGSESLVEAFNTKLAAAIVEVKKLFIDLNDFLTSTTAGFNHLAAALKAVDFATFSKEFDAAMKSFGAAGETQSVVDSINSIGTASDYVKGGFEALSKGLDDYIAASKKAATAPPPFDPSKNKEMETFEQHLQKISLQTQDVSGQFAGQLAPGFLTAAGGMKLLNDQITISSDGIATLGPQAQQLNDALLKLKGAQITQAELTPWDQYTQKIKELRLELQSGAIDQDTFSKAAAKAAGNAASAYQSYFDNLATNFAAAQDQNKAFYIAAKAASVAAATISTYEAANKALALFPPPFGEIAAGVAIAAGLANVATIVATSFAKGGRFKVPGGVSGVDTRLIPLALAPGEQVDVTPASQGGRGGRSREIVLSGLGPKDLFTGDMIRGLVDTLNQAQRDGYRLKVSTA